MIKNQTLSIRTSKEIKLLLKVAAEQERRSQASMIEVLILDYAKRHSINLENVVTDTFIGDFHG
ncbi:hypothetical protein [Vibrio vulnificus]|uniref:hypothetical protein n=1 Tax=Vibrio vulnificus TaxID=672 RepID=UPI0019D42D3B|nr:hypothetical protein [Vibrio vulnificus]MBN8094240.1 hypothetical protein [Vibrio vulnificus]